MRRGLGDRRSWTLRAAEVDSGMRWGCDRVGLSACAFAVMGLGALELSWLLGGCDATIVCVTVCVRVLFGLRV